MVTPSQYTLPKIIENRGEKFPNFSKNVRILGISYKIKFLSIHFTAEFWYYIKGLTRPYHALAKQSSVVSYIAAPGEGATGR